MTIIGQDMAPAFRAKRRNQPISLRSALWQRLVKLDVKAAAAALGFLDAKPRAAKRLVEPRLDPKVLAVAFRQGLTGGRTRELVSAVGREKKVCDQATVQTHDIDALYRPISNRSVSDILEDHEAQRAIALNFQMSGAAWRRWRGKRG